MDGRSERAQRWAVLIRPWQGQAHLVSERSAVGLAHPTEFTRAQAHDVITRLQEHGWRCDCPVECECVKLGER